MGLSIFSCIEGRRLVSEDSFKFGLDFVRYSMYIGIVHRS